TGLRALACLSPIACARRFALSDRRIPRVHSWLVGCTPAEKLPARRDAARYLRDAAGPACTCDDGFDFRAVHLAGRIGSSTADLPHPASRCDEGLRPQHNPRGFAAET